MVNDTVKHNGMDQPFLISRKLRQLVGVATNSTESYFPLEVWKQLKKNMTNNSTTSSYYIARCVGRQGARPPVGCQAGIEKNATGQNISKDCRLFKCRKTTLVSTFNCRTLSSIGKTGELTALAQEQNIDVMYPRTSDLPWWHRVEVPWHEERLGYDYIFRWKSYK